ncbi:MAG: transporter substrate-binding domain-containing protein [Nitrospira sp.]|nr:transporter substrate-binding domain-containing protein [Nitrospira sp.]
MAEKIFISYRRDTDSPTALLIFQHLTKQGYDVFIDVESLRSGDVDANLRREISTRRYFVIVLSPEAGQRLATRDGKDNWLLKELKWAIEHNLTLIPFLIGGFDFQAYSPTPLSEMEKLKNSQGVPHAGPFFMAALGKLSGLLPPANQRRNQLIGITVGCILALAVMAWGGYQIYMKLFSDTWTEITHGFDDTSKEINFKRFQGSLTSAGSRWAASFTEFQNDENRWEASGNLEGDKLVLNYTKGGNGNGLGAIVSKRIRDDTFQGYFIGYDRNKGDLVACPDILTKLDSDIAKDEFKDYLSSKCFHAGLIDRIRSTEKVRVGISIDINSPFVCVDENVGELNGFDIQLMKLIVRKLGTRLSAPKLETEFIAYQWDRMFEAVDDRDVDLIISAITKTKGRIEKFEFSDPYFATNKTYSYYKEFPPPSKHFAGRKFIVHGFTTSYDLVKEWSDDVKVVQSPRAAFHSLKQDRKRGIVVTDKEIAQYIVAKFNLEKEIETKLLDTENNGKVTPKEEYGIVVNRRETKLVQAINQSLKELKESGAINQLKDQWFLENGNPRKDNPCAAPYPGSNSSPSRSIRRQ